MDIHPFEVELFLIFLDAVPAYPGISKVRFKHARNHRDKCGFAGTIGSQKSESLFFLNFEVEASNGWIHTIVSLFSVEFS